MFMHNPFYPEKFIDFVYMKISYRYLAEQLSIVTYTLNQVIKSKSAVSPKMALRHSSFLDRIPHSWLSMQDNYKTWQADKIINISNLQPPKFLTA